MFYFIITYYVTLYYVILYFVMLYYVILYRVILCRLNFIVVNVRSFMHVAFSGSKEASSVPY